MKKFCISFVFIAIIILLMFGAQNKPNEEYLRIHIRANSNSQIDQSVKLEIRNLVVEKMTPIVAESHSKEEVIEKLNNQKTAIDALIDAYLATKGFSYKSKTEIRREEFPTRVYDEVTLEKGVYDAVIIELGEAKGDNWWCVVYPPLCFSDSNNVKYRSKIHDIINDFNNKKH